MWWSSCGRVARNVFAVLVVSAGAVRAQAVPRLELPLATLESIANDLESGRNPIYCYHGGSAEPTTALIQVDSISVVTTLESCAGVGVGFISRIDDRTFLAQAARGLMDSNPRFRVVSAFYTINTIEVNGRSIRAARSLSVLRGKNASAVDAGRTGRESGVASGTRSGS